MLVIHEESRDTSLVIHERWTGPISHFVMVKNRITQLTLFFKLIISKTST